MARHVQDALAALREDDGFTIVELLVTILVIAVSLITMMSAFDSSRRLTSTAEENETATHQAEREMERILSLSYDSIALKSVPATSTDPNNPAYYVQPGPPATYQWDRGSTGPQSADWWSMPAAEHSNRPRSRGRTPRTASRARFIAS